MSSEELVELHGDNSLPSVEDIPVVCFKSRGDGLPPVFWPLPGDSLRASPPSDFAMGADDFPKKLVYVNTPANDIPSGHEQRIAELEAMLDTTHQWLDLHAGLQTQLQLQNGKLPYGGSDVDRLKRDDYRIKVNDVIMTTAGCPWILLQTKNTASQSIRVEKSRFHTKLLETMLKGIVTVKGIADAIELAFQSIGDIINQTSSNIQDRGSWAFFNVMTWDQLTGQVRGSLRIVNYRVSAQMITVVRNKSSSEIVEVYFQFSEQEYKLNEPLFLSLQSEITAFLVENGKIKIRDPIPGGIDV